MASAAVPRSVALYLAVVQFFFALGWTVYVIFLPELLGRAGIDRRWTPWILALDQAVFAAADLAMGVAMDRARAALRSVGGWLVALVAVSSLAMLAMPAATGAGPGAFLAVTVIWVTTSAALRVPPMVLLGQHAASAAVPWLAGIVLVGLAAASALAPYLGLRLKGLDPALPFALASLAVLASAAGLVAAERHLAGRPLGPAEAAGRPLRLLSGPAVLLTAGLLLAVLGFQIQVALGAAAQITRVLDAAALPWLLPVFWGGFAFGFLPAGYLASRLGPGRVAAAACVPGALALAAAASTELAPVLIAAHAIAGASWALVLANGLGLATVCGRSGAEGRYTGILFSLLALGTLGRIGLSLGGVPQAWQADTEWLAVAAWCGAAALLFRAVTGMPRLQR